MALVLTPQITEAGKQAAINASNNGVEISITAMSFGSGFFDPVGNETAIPGEYVRLDIASGGRVTPTQVRVAAVWSDDVGTFPIGCIGFWSGSTLWAVWSRSNNVPVAVKTPGIDFVSFYDLVISAVPPNSVTVVVNPDANEALAALGAHEADPAAHPQYMLRNQFVNGHSLMFAGTVTGTANALIIPAPTEQALTAYVTGMRLTFRAASSNTAAATANVAGLGVKPIRKSGSLELVAGDIQAGAIYDLVYDGVNFQLAGGVGGGGATLQSWEFTATAGQTTFNVPHTVGTSAVYVNGRRQSVTEWTESATQFVFNAGLNAGDHVLFENFSRVAVVEIPERFGVRQWRVKLSGAAILAGDTFIPDNAAAACSYQFPTAPQDGDSFEWIASSTRFSVNAMTLVPTDKQVMGASTNILVNTDDFCGRFVFRAALDQWRVYATASAGNN